MTIQRRRKIEAAIDNVLAFLAISAIIIFVFAIPELVCRLLGVG